MDKHNAPGHAGREPQPAVKAACEVWMAARALPAIKSLPGKKKLLSPGGITVLQRNLKPKYYLPPRAQKSHSGFREDA